MRPTSIVLRTVALMMILYPGASIAEVDVPDETDAEIIFRQKAEDYCGSDRQPTSDLQAFCDAGMANDVVGCAQISEPRLRQACNVDILLNRRILEESTKRAKP